jgi:F0F1-type ATP synthase membrane subunit b/b'
VTVIGVAVVLGLLLWLAWQFGWPWLRQQIR